MSIACEFEYEKPGTLKEALALLGKKGAFALAGGTDLVAWMRDGAVKPSVVVDVKGLKELQGIEERKGAIRIGAAVPLSEVMESPVVRAWAPELAEAASMMASVGVRNRGTVAGNICSAVPCCDCGPALLVLGADIETAGTDGKKRIPIGKWFLGPRKTALPAGALVTGILIPKQEHAGAFAKLKRYRGEDLAQASAAVWVAKGGTWRVALGSVGPTPLRSKGAEAVLAGTEAPGDELLAAAGAAAEKDAAPITDIRGSQVYRRLMVGVLAKRAAETAAARLAGKGPELGFNAMEEEAE